MQDPRDTAPREVPASKRLATRTPALFLLLPLACVIQFAGDTATDATSTGTAEPATGTAEPSTGAPTTGASTTSGTTDAPPTPGDTSSSGCNFVCGDTTDPPALQCDPWQQPEQDCPEGQKCTFDGEFGHTHCVDVVPAPKGLYEPCQVLMGNELSGFDDCGPGLVCWDIDPDTGVGACVGFCLGPPESPGCADPNATCVICQECNPSVCLPGCDPLAPDCPADEVCIPSSYDDTFFCVVDASGDAGQVFDPCEFVNACDPGLMCAGSELASECDPTISGCCLPFCDLTAADCPGQGQTCLPWFEPGMGPPDLQNLGVCGLPQ